MSSLSSAAVVRSGSFIIASRSRLLVDVFAGVVVFSVVLAAADPRDPFQLRGGSLRRYASNLWLHQYDFRNPNMKGCDMRRHVDPAKRMPALAPGTELAPWLPAAGDDGENPENDEL